MSRLVKRGLLGGLVATAVGLAAITHTGEEEGLRLKAYIPIPGDVPTICYGETKGVRMGQTATKAECDAMLLKRLDEFASKVEACVKAPMSDPTLVSFVGLAYNINESMRFQVQGRYMGTTNPSVNTPFGNVSYQNQNILALAGVTWKFGVTPPPPPPAAAPVAPPSYMVFFDWDRSNLSAQALNTIKQAAQAYKTKGNARITATGHTDTSGSEQYNMALSLRRANAVKDALVREGVPATAIAVVGRGEQGLLVQTGPNVREPQNRRVEIVIQ